MNNIPEKCKNNHTLWRNCMYTWEGRPLENSCLRFKIRFEKCKEVFINKNNNGKKIIIINKISKIK